MQYEELLEALRRRLGQDVESPGTVLAATVQAVSEDAWQESADLRAQLPGELANVEPAGPGQRRSLDEFVARIGQLTGTEDTARAREYARAGFDVIGTAVTAGQLRQLMEALPEDYGELAPSVSGFVGHDEALLAEVRRGADLETVEQARELTEAVLTVMTEAGSGGQADRLAKALPQQIGTFLQGAERAQHTDSDRFLAEIAERSSVTTPALVREHTGAVFTALRQWAPGELAELLDQLPRPITELARRAGEPST